MHKHNLADVFTAGNEFAESAANEIVKRVKLHTSLPKCANENDDVTRPGGFVEELVDWVVSSAERPSRWLALSAVLPFVAALVGRRFESPTGLRSNLYVAALAPSGFGKDHARSQLKKLALKAGVATILGPSRFMSASALRSALVDKPSCICMVDEFDSLMQQINDPRAGIHNTLIRGDLKDLWSASQTFFDGSEYASTKAVRLFHPNLCIYGTGTPEAFWKTISGLNTAEGLLPRFILFDVDGPRPARIARKSDVSDVPVLLSELCRELLMAGRPINKLEQQAQSPLLEKGDKDVSALRVPMDENATAKLEEFKRQIDAFTCDEVSAPLINRAAEHAVKLALVVAVATDWDAPVITGEIMQWAITLAWRLTTRMLAETTSRVSDSVREGNYKRILEQIKKAKDGITDGKIADANRGMPARDRKDIIQDLIGAERIKGRITIGKKGRPRCRYHFLK